MNFTTEVVSKLIYAMYRLQRLFQFKQFDDSVELRKGLSVVVAYLNVLIRHLQRGDVTETLNE
jgi:hypothetical protein